MSKIRSLNPDLQMLQEFADDFEAGKVKRFFIIGLDGDGNMFTYSSEWPYTDLVGALSIASFRAHLTYTED